MAVPKRRTASTSRNQRRSHHARRPVMLGPCPRCQQPVPGHTACPNCGTYRGRDVIDVVKQQAKQDRKQKAKARTTGK